MKKKMLYALTQMLRFETTKMLIAVLENEFIVSFIIIFGTLSSHIVSPVA